MLALYADRMEKGTDCDGNIRHGVYNDTKMGKLYLTIKSLILNIPCAFLGRVKLFLLDQTSSR